MADVVLHTVGFYPNVTNPPQRKDDAETISVYQAYTAGLNGNTIPGLQNQSSDLEAARANAYSQGRLARSEMNTRRYVSAGVALLAVIGITWKVASK